MGGGGATLPVGNYSTYINAMSSEMVNKRKEAGDLKKQGPVRDS